MNAALETPRGDVHVVVKRSSWTKWVEQEPDARVAALLASGDETVRNMNAAHSEHTQTVDEVRSALTELGVTAHWSEQPHEFRVDSRCRLVVIVGGDGTLLGASHGVGPGVPLLGVNSSPAFSVGFFCGARKGSVKATLAAALEGSLKATELTRMRVEVSGRVLHERVLNEALFCHVSPAATSRYILRVLAADGRTIAEEEHKSSGVWMGPAAGSTGAQRSAGGNRLPLTSSDLQYVVREPFCPLGETLRLTLGLVGEGQSLSIKSKMRKACIFLDGDHLVHEVELGDVVRTSRSSEPLIVLGLRSP